MSSNMILMPIFLTGLLSINESRVGLMLIFQSLGMAFAAGLGGRLSDKFGRIKFVIFGLSLMIFSNIFITQFNISTSRSAIFSFNSGAFFESNKATTWGLNFLICSANSSTLLPADKASISKLSGFRSITSSVLTPMEPVEPRIEIFFI